MNRRLSSLFATLMTAMVLMVGSGQLVGCGQKGPLYLPDQQPDEQPSEEPGTDTPEPVAPEPAISEPAAEPQTSEPAAPAEND